MPSTRPGARGADPFEQARLAARELSRQAGTDHHDILVVLGTGLYPLAAELGAEGGPIDLSALPWFPRFTGVDHRPEAWSFDRAGKRLLVLAGRLHLYEGLTPVEVVHPLRTALATGITTVILTCSAGGIRPDWSPGQVVAISDHLNLTAASPLAGIPSDHSAGWPYIDLTDTWSPRLRAMAREVDPELAEGVYAQMPGPHLETPAEIRMLATLGAELVGMSTVPEAIAARHLGAEVLGLAVVTNPAAGVASGPLEVAAFGEAAAKAVEPLRRILGGVIERLEPPERKEPEGAAGR